MSTKQDLERLLSVQPFWEAAKLNRDLLLDDATGAPIAVAYELQTAPDVDGLTCVPGIGLVGILFSLDPDDPRAICCGALNKSKKVPLYGISHVLSCQFFPGEFTRIFGVPSNELADREFPLEDLLHVGDATEQIAGAGSFAESLALTREFIRRWENRTKGRDVGKLPQSMMQDILNRHGDVRMSELEEQTGYSSRYLQKLMLEQVGLAPKTALANIRFQNALRILTEEPFVAIAEVAQRCGYYDQSHFTKVFKEYVGVTPSIFQERIRQNFFSGELPKK